MTQTYTTAVRDKILFRLSEGKLLKDICDCDEMPDIQTVRNWITDDVEGFAAKYARARESQLDYFADETISLADSLRESMPKDLSKEEQEEWRADHYSEGIKQGIKARQWLLGRDKRYSQKGEVEAGMSLIEAMRAVDIPGA